MNFQQRNNNNKGNKPRNINRQRPPVRPATGPAVVYATQPRYNPAPKQQRNNKVTAIGNGLRTIGSLAGAYFGSAALGKQVGAGVSRIFGQGDYVTNLGGANVGTVPAFSPLTSGCRMQHREYIKDISSTTAFASQSFSINPGQSALFPWLSSVAVNFEEYRLHGMVVYLNSTSASSIASTNTALGIWGAVTQYDPTEADFSNKQQAENYVGCQTSSPSTSVLHAIECKPSAGILTKKYVRSSAVADTEDLKFYDHGKIQIFTSGAQASSVIGEMWVSYDIEFFKPRLPSGGYNAASDMMYNAAYSGTILPTNQTAQLGSTIGSYTTTGDALFIPGSAPNASYLLTIYWQFTADVVNLQVPVAAYSGSVSAANLMYNGSSNRYSAPTPTVTQKSLATAICFRKTTSVDGKITFSGGLLGITGMFMMTLTLLAPGIGSVVNSRVQRLNLDEVHSIRTLMNNPKFAELINSLKSEEEEVRLKQKKEDDKIEQEIQSHKISYEHLD